MPAQPLSTAGPRSGRLEGWRAAAAPSRRLLLDQLGSLVPGASMVNPMTGEGIYYAVATGIAAGRTAARAVRSGRPEQAGRVHRREVRRLLGTHLRHTWVSSRLAQSPAVVDAGIRAAGRDVRVFDTLVEIGLGDGRIARRLVTGLAGGLVGGLAGGLAVRPGQP